MAKIIFHLTFSWVDTTSDKLPKNDDGTDLKGTITSCCETKCNKNYADKIEGETTSGSTSISTMSILPITLFFIYNLY